MRIWTRPEQLGKSTDFTQSVAAIETKKKFKFCPVITKNGKQAKCPLMTTI